MVCLTAIRVSRRSHPLHDRQLLLVILWYALSAYPVTGKAGAIIGSKEPWAEVLCLRSGAKHLTTVDYHEIHIEHPKMRFLGYVELLRQHIL